MLKAFKNFTHTPLYMHLADILAIYTASATKVGLTKITTQPAWL